MSNPSQKGYTFEKIIYDILVEKGYEVEWLLGMKSGDGGVDMIVFHEDCTIFIQCKNHTGNIGRGPVQALGGWLSRLFLCCWSIVVAHRNNEKEEKFDDAAVIVKEAETCRNSIRLSYASTIVEDIENLVSTALAIKEKPVHWRFGEET